MSLSDAGARVCLPSSEQYTGCCKVHAEMSVRKIGLLKNFNFFNFEQFEVFFCLANLFVCLFFLM